jgi:dihydroflavonol-4-reductase
MVLVTGATGFLGHSLCPYLVRQGYRVRALVRPTSDAAFLTRIGVELWEGDVRDPSSVERATEGCRYVVHAAGRFRFWGAPREFETTNVVGTANTLHAALRARVERIVHISTLVVVGAPESGQVLDEEVACRPRDPYQRSKLRAEQLARAAHRERRLPVVVLRPGAFYGPWSRYAFNRLFFEDPLKGLPLGIHGGRHITFPVFVPDVARVIEAAFTRGRPGEIYNVVGQTLSHAQVHAAISRLAGIRPRRINPPGVAMIGLAQLWTWASRYTGHEPYYSINMVPYVFGDWRATSAKAVRELGFRATPFEEGVHQTLSWYRAQKIRPVGWPGRLVAWLWRAREISG